MADCLGILPTQFAQDVTYGLNGVLVKSYLISAQKLHVHTAQGVTHRL